VDDLFEAGLAGSPTTLSFLLPIPPPVGPLNLSIYDEVSKSTSIPNRCDCYDISIRIEITKDITFLTSTSPRCEQTAHQKFRRDKIIFAQRSYRAFSEPCFNSMPHTSSANASVVSARLRFA
jgi:hypothetical protein